MKNNRKYAAAGFMPFLCSRYLLLVLIVSSSVFPAQVTQAGKVPEKPELLFERVPYRMASSHVFSLYQDSYGFIWTGSLNGLSRFDSDRFVVYASTEDTLSLAHNTVRVIYEDRNRNLWIGGRESVSRYRRETNDFQRYNLAHLTESRLLVTIRTITEDSRGKLWISGGTNGLYYYDPEKDAFKTYEPLLSHSINTIYLCDEDLIWATTRDHGLQRINPETGDIDSWRHDPADPHSLSSDYLNYIVRDHDGNLWVSARQHGLNRIVKHEDGRLSFVRYKNTPDTPTVLENNSIYFMYVDSKGRLWVGNDNGGLHLYDREYDIFHHYTSNREDPYSLSNESIASIMEDRDGRLWVGTAMGGLNVADPYSMKFRHIHTRSSYLHPLSSNVVRGFEEDQDHNIWIATDGGGLNVMDRRTGHIRAFRHDPEISTSIQSDAVLCVRQDSDGRIWAGSYNGGLDILLDSEIGVFASFEDEYGIPEKIFSSPFDIHFDRDQPFIWVAEFRRGLYRYHTETGEMHLFRSEADNEHSLTTPNIMQIFEDSRNNLWLATLNGLNRLSSTDKKKGHFTTYFPDPENPNSIPSATIRQIAEDRLGRIWVATTNGLALYREESDDFKIFGHRDGLPDNVMQSLVVDHNNHLWIGSMGGLTYFIPEMSYFRNYGVADGLQGYEFSRYAGHKLESGELLFGGMNGFNLFHPEHIVENPHIPPVYLTHFSIFNEPASIGLPDSPMDKHVMLADKITLSHWQNVIRFEFVALNYTRPEQNQYRYMMEGFESEWNEAGNRGEAVYTNLSPGTYRFRVLASNNDGVWNTEGAAITVVVIPPFWQTTWFYALVSVTGLLLVLYLFRRKIKDVQERNRKLEEMVSQRTRDLAASNDLLNEEIAEKNKIYSVLAHDLRNPFMSIIGFSDLMIEKFRQTNDSENRDMSESIRQAAKTSYQLLENLLEWAGTRSKHQKAERKTMVLKTIVDETISDNLIAAKRKNVSLINHTEPDITAQADANMVKVVLRNLISNAIKYSNESSIVVVSAREKTDHVIVSVTDSGIGIDPKEQSQLFSVLAASQRRGTSGEKGSGFGLMLCKDFVTQNGGKIWVESEPGKGSTFSFTLKKNN